VDRDAMQEAGRMMTPYVADERTTRDCADLVATSGRSD
jgi:hypothetical protein